MALTLKSFGQLVQDQAAAVQARANALIDFTVGSVMRAFIEANAAVGVWLESCILYVLALTRASTSKGADLDSWVLQFGVTRLAAQASIGAVVFARYSPNARAIVPIGGLVRTPDGTQTFVVVLDPLNSAYSSDANGYVLQPGVGSLSVPVKAMGTGQATNVQAGTITQVASVMPGIDTVTNPAPLTGGGAAETDQQLLDRFVLWIAGLSKATRLAVLSTIANLQLGLQCTVTENVLANGAAKPGYFFVVVDDGTGRPSPALVSTCAAAVEEVRPLGIPYGVQAPTVRNVRIDFRVEVGIGYDPIATIGAAGDAVVSFVNALPLGAGLPYTRLLQVAYDASPGVANVTNLTVDRATADIPGLPTQTIKAPAQLVTVASA